MYQFRANFGKKEAFNQALSEVFTSFLKILPKVSYVEPDVRLSTLGSDNGVSAMCRKNTFFIKKNSDTEGDDIKENHVEIVDSFLNVVACNNVFVLSNTEIDKHGFEIREILSDKGKMQQRVSVNIEKIQEQVRKEILESSDYRAWLNWVSGTKEVVVNPDEYEKLNNPEIIKALLPSKLKELMAEKKTITAYHKVERPSASELGEQSQKWGRIVEEKIRERCSQQTLEQSQNGRSAYVVFSNFFVTTNANLDKSLLLDIKKQSDELKKDYKEALINNIEQVLSDRGLSDMVTNFVHRNDSHKNLKTAQTPNASPVFG